MSDLKPCPFCGGAAKFLVKSHSERGITSGWEFGICCTKCNVTTPITCYKLEVHLNGIGLIEITEDERQQAIDAWNRRVSE